MKEGLKLVGLIVLALALKDILNRVIWDKTLDSILPSNFEENFEPEA